MGYQRKDQWEHTRYTRDRILESKAGLITTGGLMVICLAGYFLFGPVFPVVIGMVAFFISGIGFVLFGFLHKGSAIHKFFGSVCLSILTLAIIASVIKGVFFPGRAEWERVPGT